MKIALSKRTIERQGKIYDAIENAWYKYLDGNELTFVPNHLDQDFDAIAHSVDCYIITGGDNRLIRRKTERRMIISMMKMGKPVIGICHGCFLLTKFLGGTTKKKDGHKDGVEHNIIYNTNEYTVNSYHRYYIDTLPSNTKILAVDNENHCEAWIDGNLAGVVWHPERMESGWVPTEIGKLFGKST